MVRGGGLRGGVVVSRAVTRHGRRPVEGGNGGVQRSGGGGGFVC